MKTFYFKDGLQIIAAILITGSMAYAMQPTAVETSSENTAAVQQLSQSEPTPTAEVVTAPVAEPAPEKVVTWQDNPNKCDQNTQYISEEPPFACIDKPAPTESAAPAVAQSASNGGSCDQWIAAAGITDVVNANELIRRESGCNPYAVNASSGACGVAQELPCGKSKCGAGNGFCQVRWMNDYVINRYGSWANAVSFHNANNWY